MFQLHTSVIDSVIVNAWKFYRLVNSSKVRQIDFKSEVDRTFMTLSVEVTDDDKTLTIVTPEVRKVKSNNILPDSVRFDRRTKR